MNLTWGGGDRGLGLGLGLGLGSGSGLSPDELDLEALARSVLLLTTYYLLLTLRYLPEPSGTTSDISTWLGIGAG